jgi:hypothetical protein
MHAAVASFDADGDEGGIVLTESAVNEYLQSFPTPPLRAGALHLLQDALTPLWQASSGGQTIFLV